MFDWDDPVPELSGGGLPGNYEYHNSKFHWGEAEKEEGSEHQVDGIAYVTYESISCNINQLRMNVSSLSFQFRSVLELQMYHWNKEYNDFDDAKTKRDGVAVLSILYDLGDDNQALKPVIDNLPKIHVSGGD